METGTPRPVEHFALGLSPRQIESAQAAHLEAIASQAYLYALPAFIHMRQLTEFIGARRYLSPEERPIGGWILVRELSNPTTSNRYPNVDTLYGAAFLLLDQHGPVTLEIPAIDDRYFSVAFHDAFFDNFAIAGTSSGETRGARLLIVPPGWEGEVPAGVDRVVYAPTSVVNLYQRIFVKDSSEYELLHALQDRFVLEPLSGGPFPELDLTPWNVPGMREVSDPVRMLELANPYLALNGWPGIDEGLVALFDSVGVGPRSEVPSLSWQLDAIRAGAARSQATIDARLTAGPFRNGWNVPDPLAGVPGPHVLSRAATQVSQIGSLLPSEAMYFFAHLDGEGSTLHGSNRYQLRFPVGGLPPLGEHGFWSVTMYGVDALLVDNPMNRYIIRPDSAGLEFDQDGSLTIHIQPDAPAADAEPNWLPSPHGEFVVGFRAYRPLEPVQTGEWFLPPVERV